MKIVLINPPSNKPLRAEIPLKIDKEIGAFPSLGLLYIASYIRKNNLNDDIKIIDAKVDCLSLENIESLVNLKTPDLVGITVMTFSLLDTIDIIKIIKKASLSTKICLGGPHVSIYPRESLSIKGVDFVILGEGEIVFLDLINKLKQDKPDFSLIAGLGCKDENGNLFINEKKQFISNLDALAIPDRKLINYKKCYSLLGRDKFTASVQTTRGCPFRCVYCDQQSGKILRKRSVSNIIEEIRQLYELGIRDIFFIDDLFTLDKSRVYEFCDLLINKKINISFKISSRVDTIDKKMLKMLKMAGCYRIHYGAESGTQKTLNILNKRITLEQTRDAFKLTREAGIEIFAYFMMGCPGETRREILETINFSINLKPDYAHFSIATPYPDTELYKMAREAGIIKDDYWRNFAISPNDDFKTKFWAKELSSEELVSLQNYANKRFYLRPLFLVKELLKTYSWRVMLKKLKTGWSILNPKK